MNCLNVTTVVVDEEVGPKRMSQRGLKSGQLFRGSFWGLGLSLRTYSMLMVIYKEIVLPTKTT
jgi:hypothetical protein